MKQSDKAARCCSALQGPPVSTAPTAGTQPGAPIVWTLGKGVAELGVWVDRWVMHLSELNAHCRVCRLKLLQGGAAAGQVTTTGAQNHLVSGWSICHLPVGK
jgi:hypothetical protein